jgi:hypothetical protein
VELAGALAPRPLIATTIAAVQSDPCCSERVRSVSRSGTAAVGCVVPLVVFGEFGTLCGPLPYCTRQVFIVLRSGQAIDLDPADRHPSWLRDGAGLP